MQLEGSLVAMAKAWMLAFVVIVQHLFFSYLSSILSGPKKVSLDNRMQKLV